MTSLLLCIVVLLLSVASTDAYTYRIIDTLFPGATIITITGLSDQDAVIGIYRDMGSVAGHHGFLGEDGLTSRHRRPYPLLFTTPKGINNHGVVTGFYGSDPGFGFLYHDGNLWPFLGPRRPAVAGQLSTTNFPFLTEPQGINNNGVVVGYYRYPARIGAQGNPSQEPPHGFIYDTQKGTLHSLDIPGAFEVFPVAISDTGRVIGHVTLGDGSTHLFSWLDGETSYFTLPLDDPNLAGITTSGVIAGNVGRAGFVWDGGDIQTIEVPGAVFTDVTGIRDDGTVYGWFQGPGEGDTRSFIATPDGRRVGRSVQRLMRGAPSGASDSDLKGYCTPASKRRMCRDR